MSDLEQHVIYCNPVEYPGRWVVRRWFIRPGVDPIPDTRVEVCMSLREARTRIPGDRVCLPRFPSDDPAIYEVWI